MSSLWTDLLFLHGHITNADLARRLSQAPAPKAKPRGSRSRDASASPVGQDAQPRTVVSPRGGVCSPT